MFLPPFALLFYQPAKGKSSLFMPQNERPRTTAAIRPMCCRGGSASRDEKNRAAQPKATPPQIVKNLLGGSEGRSPPKGIPNPATCAVGSEALPSKVSLRRTPPGGAEGAVGGRRKSGGKGRQRRTFSTSWGGTAKGHAALQNIIFPWIRAAQAQAFSEEYRRVSRPSPGTGAPCSPPRCRECRPGKRRIPAPSTACWYGSES